MYKHEQTIESFKGLLDIEYDGISKKKNNIDWC